MKYFTTALLVVGMSLVQLASAAEKEAGVTALENAVRVYPLSIDKIRHWGVATKAMQADMKKLNAAEQTPGCKNIQAAFNAATDMAEMVRAYEGCPPMMAYYKTQGLSAQDAVLMPFAVMNATVAAMYTTPEQMKASGLNPQAAAVYKQNKAEIDALSKQLNHRDSDDQDDQ